MQIRNVQALKAVRREFVKAQGELGNAGFAKVDRFKTARQNLSASISEQQTLRRDIAKDDGPEVAYEYFYNAITNLIKYVK